MSHTATPWRVQEKGIRCLIRGADGTIVAVRHRLPGETHEANAEFIVRACNCHDELLAACEGIADDDVRQAYEVLDFGPGGTTDEFKAQQLIDERMAAVRAAIAIAKGCAL